MASLGRDSASLSSRSRTHSRSRTYYRPRTTQRPPSPPVVARCGIAIVEEDTRDSASHSSRSRTTQRPLSPPVAAMSGITIVEEDGRDSASHSSRSRTTQRPPSPPAVARCGIAIVEEGGRDGFKNRGYVSGRTGGEGNSRGKGKSKTHETVTGRPAKLVSEGSSKVNATATGNFNGNVMYRLYFKGLLSEETGNGKGRMTDLVACFGFAICDQRDNLLFDLKGPLVGPGTNRQGAEIMALTRGLTEATKLGIKHVTIYCDSFPIFQFVRGNWVPKQKKVSLLMDDLQRIRQQFLISQAVLVAGNEVKFAYKLARESIVSQITPPHRPQGKVARKEECLICYNHTVADRMFSVGKCRHRFCLQCVKQHVEVKLLHGMVPKCPHEGCNSELVIDACGKLLTPKLSELWKQRIKEKSIPVAERIYCPYPKCSALMSKTKISETAKSLLSVYPTSGVRRCVECRGLFCVDCKVPWHGKMSCTEYKKLHPNPPADDVKLKSLANNKMWRQCSKCQHMIELTQGCNHITCRCGHEFCYNCGEGWNKKTETCVKSCPNWDEAYIFGQANNYFDDDDEDYDSDEDFEYPFHFGNRMNGREEPFDPFFDLPDGVIFTPDMLMGDPNLLRQLYDSDDESDDQAGHTGFPQYFTPFGTVADEDCPYFGKYGKYTPVYDSDGYEIEDYTNPFHPDYL